MPRDGRIATTLLVISGSIITASILWLFQSAFDNSREITELHATAFANSIRIENLETGRTTPMATETRARIESMQRQIDALRRQ